MTLNTAGGVKIYMIYTSTISQTAPTTKAGAVLIIKTSGNLGEILELFFLLLHAELPFSSIALSLAKLERNK